MQRHQYIERHSKKICDERLYGHQAIRFLYSNVREQSPWLFRKLTSARISDFLAYHNFDGFLSSKMKDHLNLQTTINLSQQECLAPPEKLDSLKKIFERKIRYWQCRPMPDDPLSIVSPADARVLVGSFADTSSIHIKEKFFDFQEMLGYNKETWLKTFDQGDFAVFRLTPEKYHYNHTPVAGKVVDFWECKSNCVNGFM